MQATPNSHFRNPLDDILGTIATVRVLRALVITAAPMTQTELVRDTRLSRGSVLRGIDALHKAGILHTWPGRSPMYVLRDAHPLMPAIRALFTEEFDRPTRVFDAIRHSAARHSPPILGVWLYGSVARAEDSNESDFDVAVMVDADESERAAARLREDMLVVQQAFEVTISLLVFGPDEFHDLPIHNPTLWRNLTTDALVLYGNTPEAVAAVIARRKTHPSAALESTPHDD